MRKFPFYFSSMIACLFLAFNSGCASGGYKITREYAQWINSKSLIIRIILYIFTSFVFGITLLIDTVIFNTIDFWQGKVSDGSFEFKDADRIYHVQHKTLPGTGLKQSTIKIENLNGSSGQEIVLSETITGEIEMHVDGILRTRVRDVNSLPVVSLFDLNGKIQEEKTLALVTPNLAQLNSN